MPAIYSKAETRKAIVIFLALTLALSTVVWLATFNAGSTGRIGGRIFGYGIMWCPALATFLTCKILNRKISTLAWGWGSAKYQWQSYLIPLLYALIAYLVIWLTGWGGFYNKTFVNQVANELGWNKLPPGVIIVLFFIVEGAIGLPGSIATAFGEELGWRGFLVPEMSKLTSYTKVSIFTGIIWSVWHYPDIIFGNYNNGTPEWYSITCFTVMVISMCFVFTWFRLKSGSLWTGVMLHASHNLFIQGIFTPLTIQTAHTKYFIDEFGAVIPAVTVLFAIYFWTRRKELEKDQ